MTRRSFFSRFTAVLAALPVVGKVFPRAIANPEWTKAGQSSNIILEPKSIFAKNYFGKWDFGVEDYTALLYFEVTSGEIRTRYKGDPRLIHRPSSKEFSG